MPPDLVDLQERLVGHTFPGGSVTFAPYEAWLGHDAMRSPNAGGAVLDPLWIFVAALRGMGIDIAALVELAGATPDGALLGELGLRQDAPLRAGVEYGVTGGIVDLTRRTGRRAGVFDTLTVELELTDGGRPVAGVTSSFLFPREAA